MLRSDVARRWSRRGIGAVLALHGLAHALAGMRATDAAGGGATGSGALLWIVTVAWALAAGGFLAGGLGLAGAPPLVRRWRPALWTGAVASGLLLPVTGSTWVLPGMAFSVATLAGLAYSRPRTEPGAGASPTHGSRSAVRRVAGRLSGAAAVGLVAYLVLLILVRPWHVRWGSSDHDLLAPLPGDETAPAPTYQVQHAVLIQAPPEAVWPWLAQLGHDRGGFYSYARLENAFGLRVRNADRVHPEWQALAAGDSVLATPDDYLGTGRRFGWRVARAEPGRVLVLERWGAFVLEPAGAGATRLIVRTRGNGGESLPSVMLAPLSLMVLEPAHFIMERRMLLGIRERAERSRLGAAS